ncbi:pilus assembly protein TadG-related protein [Defluviimonas sp. WL0002]|uniref:Pilus assembly protein TadG-related protein n=1 Tax=Albidovulum marisflavi TaxID=2984159 RepID=A0ABT2ZA58_9RHOB|nr:pilus assembly protein TadG-related protein [Defluviimonas sp. WL0002]MCV2867986.1 pilus assembly protein TadG-related protein [Defluviimonas sp. WL0002]
MRRTAARFAKDEEGAILVIVAVSLGTILGMIALSYDLGRMAATTSELQSFADHVALTAAGELDGENGARARAQAAATNFFTDRQTFADDNTGQVLNADDFTLTFLRSLPALDTTAITSANSATTDNDAVYARVQVTPKTVPFTFGRAFFALLGFAQRTPTFGAEAVAGFTTYACDITPMMFCMPPNFDANTWEGRTILMRAGGNGSAWGPGDFGFLQPSTLAIDSTGNCGGLSGPQGLSCVLGAAGSITQCFRQRGVDTEPGQKNGLTNSLNTRFDMWPGDLNPARDGIVYAPAPGVIKGLVANNGNACINNNSNPSPNTVPLPPDDCFAAGTCTRYGDGIWSTGRTNYINTNYGTPGNPPSPVPHGSATTRYELYLSELAGNYSSTTPAILPSGKAETGRPMCGAAPFPDPARRELIIAAVDCSQGTVAEDLRGSATNIPVKEYVRMFLLQPVGPAPELSIYGEVIGSAGGNGNSGSGVFHEVVQLYR